MKICQYFTVAALVAALLFITPLKAQTAAQKIITQAQTLTAKQQYQQAYQLLSAKEADFGGQPQFDYYLGLSALQSGKPAEAVFAFERALDARPDFQQARAELGRAYYYLGENKAAKAEFEQIKADTKVPSGVKNTIDKFLTAIDSRFDSSGRRLEFYIEAGLGYDTNVNAATDVEEAVFFSPDSPIPFSVALSDDSQATDSSFITAKPGLRYSEPISDDLNFFASADALVTAVNDADQFSSNTFNVSTGIAKLAGVNQYNASLAYQQFKIDEQDFGRDLISLTAQWLRTLNPKNKLTSYLQLAQASYEDGERDGDINSIGVNWLQGSARSLMIYGLYFGQESVDKSGQQQQAKDFLGLKLGSRYSWRRSSIFTNLVYQVNSFKADDPLQNSRRRDGSFISFDVGIDIPLTRKLKLKPKLTFAQNSTDENIDVFDYDRTVFDITAAYTF